jgi:hypothetical protein
LDKPITLSDRKREVSQERISSISADSSQSVTSFRFVKFDKRTAKVSQELISEEQEEEDDGLNDLV